MRRPYRSFLALLALSLSSCQNVSDPAARGKAVFASYDCKKCHTVAGVGGTLGPDLTFVGFRKTPEFLDTWLKDPHAWKKNVSMPNFYFKDNVRADLVAYLSGLKGQGYLDGERPWDMSGLKDAPAKRGHEIFQRVGCVTCHGKGGTGGYPNNNVVGGKIPALDKVTDGYSREELVKKISDGVLHPEKKDPSDAAPLLYMPKWQEKLKADEIEAVVAYLFSLKSKGGGEDW